MKIKGKEIILFDDKSKYLDRFGLVLALTVGSIILLSLVNVYQPEQAFGPRLFSTMATLTVGVTLLLALRAAGLAHRWMLPIDITISLIVIATAILVFTDNFLQADPTRKVSAPLILVVIAALAPLVVIRRLIQHRRVTRGTLFGAIAAYLLIPIAYFYVFIAVNDLQGFPFFGTEQASPTYMYFSLATLTTIGYGDVTSQSNVGHLLSTSEAIIGQIYLVSFVAMLVGLFAQQWQESKSNEQSE
jgi:hypothetical protein